MSGRELTEIQKARGLVADAFLAAAGGDSLTASEVKAMLLVHNMLDQVNTNHAPQPTPSAAVEYPPHAGSADDILAKAAN